MDFQKKRFQLLGFIIGLIVISFTAEKFRQIIGETRSSQSGKFTIFNCLDGGSGTVACLVKEGVKLYTYNIRTVHVELARNKAIEASIADAISQGMEPKAAAKKAQKDGAKAAKQATRKAKRIIGPIISSGWDFFEAIYYGGTSTEGFLRGTGTLFGTYFIGYLGEERFGRVGYLVGSQFGSWIGGRMGLMVYDIASGIHFLLQFGQSEENAGEKVDFFQAGQTEGNIGHNDHGNSFFKTIMGYVGSYMSETSTDVSSEVVDEFDTYKSPVYESFESPVYESFESPVYESFESPVHESFESNDHEEL